MHADPDIHRVAVAVMPGAPLFELAVPCDIFGIARPDLVDPWYDLRVCATEPGAVVASGFAATTAYGMDELAAADTVIVPACTDVHASPPGALVEAVRTAHDRGARIAAICSGAFVLAAAGLLDGRRATTHWMHASELQRRYPRVRVDETVLYTQDGRIFTSAGTAAGIDLCIELVRQDHGVAVAAELARRTVTPPHRPADQAQYIRAPMPEDSPALIHDVAVWVRGHLDRPLRLRDLAAHAHLSERQLARRFHDAFGMSPGEWLTGERIRRAQELLETTSLPVDAIAGLTGFGTADGLRTVFRHRLRVSPTQYRQTWGRTA